jgi:acetyl-CoA C-acetyltransferase
VAEPVTGQSASPVLVGWSQVNRYEGEPLAAWAAALRATGVPPGAIDSLDVVYCQSWPYDDPPGRLAAAAGAEPRRVAYSGIGGTTPLALLARAAERIARGEADVCAIVGGEALATVRRLRRAGERPAWSHRHPDPGPVPFEAPFHPSEVAHQVFQAYTTFALRDVARRAHRGEAPDSYRDAIGRLFAPMTTVAAANPDAWFPVERSAAELVIVTEGNRMVAYPYTKRVTAMMDVDLAAALVLASPEAAARLGVPADRRVRLRGWAEARDPDYVAEHRDLWRSPGMAAALGGALARAGTGIDDVACFDVYSCFPSAVSFSLDALGLDSDDRRGPFTVTGGLPYAGGPGSCYALGSTAAMADALVADPGSLGLVTAVGMHLSKHAAVVLSTEPGPLRAVGPGVTPVPAARCPIVPGVEGPATVAAYTVHHGRDGAPADALLVCTIGGPGGGARCYATSRDPDLVAALEAEEWVGRTVRLRPDGEANVASA